MLIPPIFSSAEDMADTLELVRTRLQPLLLWLDELHDSEASHKVSAALFILLAHTAAKRTQFSREEALHFLSDLFDKARDGTLNQVIPFDFGQLPPGTGASTDTKSSYAEANRRRTRQRSSPGYRGNGLKRPLLAKTFKAAQCFVGPVRQGLAVNRNVGEPEDRKDGGGIELIEPIPLSQRNRFAAAPEGTNPISKLAPTPYCGHALDPSHPFAGVVSDGRDIEHDAPPCPSAATI